MDFFFPFLDMIMLSVCDIYLNTEEPKMHISGFFFFVCCLPSPTCPAGRKDSDRHVHAGLLLNTESLQAQQLQR